MGCGRSKTTAVEDGPDVKSTSKPNVKPTQAAAVIDKKCEQATKTGVLALRECGLTAVPQAATSNAHASVRTVDLTNNKLTALPEDIGVWEALQTLSCNQNAMKKLPAAVGELQKLQKLTLSENQLQTLPAELAQLGKLKHLALDSNKLGPRILSDAFCGNIGKVLEELDISGNELEELPKLDDLAALQRLIVARNKLNTLTEALGKLSSLQHLDAADNRITSVHANLFTGCISLSELWLKGNPMDRLVLQETPGFQGFLERRKQRLDAKIGANVVGRVDLTVCGLE